MYQYGFLILLALLFTGLLSYIVGPVLYLICRGCADLNPKRVVSGMRPTGRCTSGTWWGAPQWVALQGAIDCYYFVADWHA